jgi:hypothetical protein
VSRRQRAIVQSSRQVEECGSERETLFWFLLGSFNQTNEATFSGGIGRIKLSD